MPCQTSQWGPTLIVFWLSYGSPEAKVGFVQRTQQALNILRNHNFCHMLAGVNLTILSNHFFDYAILNRFDPFTVSVKNVDRAVFCRDILLRGSARFDIIIRRSRWVPFILQERWLPNRGQIWKNNRKRLAAT